MIKQMRVLLSLPMMKQELSHRTKRIYLRGLTNGTRIYIRGLTNGTPIKDTNEKNIPLEHVKFIEIYNK